MPFTISLCTSTGIPHIFTVISRTFKHTQPYISAVFPAHDTPTGHAQAVSRFLYEKHTDPSLRFTKAVDTTTGQIIGQANWIVAWKAPVTETLEGDFWESEEEGEFARELFGQFLVMRQQAVREARGPVIVLDILSVLPEYQGSGAGYELVKWGAEVADRIGADILVEATMNAVPFYERQGFRGTERLRFEFSERFADRRKPELLFMRRPARSID